MTENSDCRVREEFVQTSNGFRHGTCPERLSTSWNHCPRCGAELVWGKIKRFYDGE